MGQYTVTVRGFAPWNMFGVFGDRYAGDGRSFSALPSGDDGTSSRIHCTFGIDTDIQKVGEPLTWADQSRGPFNFVFPDATVSGVPSAVVDGRATNGTFHVNARVSGGNPLQTHVFNPDIDILLSIDIRESGQTLNVNTKLGGDLFPCAEILIANASRPTETVWLAGFCPTQNRPGLSTVFQTSIWSLFGSGEPLNQDHVRSDVIVRKDDSGAFVSVEGRVGGVGEVLELGVPPWGESISLVPRDEWNGSVMSLIESPVESRRQATAAESSLSQLEASVCSSNDVFDPVALPISSSSRDGFGGQDGLPNGNGSTPGAGETGAVNDARPTDGGADDLTGATDVYLPDESRANDYSQSIRTGPDQGGRGAQDKFGQHGTPQSVMPPEPPDDATDVLTLDDLAASQSRVIPEQTEEGARHDVTVLTPEHTSESNAEWSGQDDVCHAPPGDLPPTTHHSQ